MSKNPTSGPVSLSLLSLKAQVDTLLEEAGGEAALKLLDKLSKLSTTEQEQALQIMSNFIDRLTSGNVRLLEKDTPAKRFEDELYDELLDSLNLADSPVPLTKSKLKLEVVNGGKSDTVTSGSVVSLDSIRKTRLSSSKPTIN